MLLLRRNLGRRIWRRRLCSAVTLFAYLLAGLGIPLPAAEPHPKDFSQPFPCQDHSCGCRTAEQCWTHCCCFSPEQRWAWARTHHVKPPAYAEKPVATGWRTPRKRDQVKSCSPDQGPQCCQTESVTNTQSPENSPKKTPAGKNTKGSHWVLGIRALACQGLTTLWASSGSVLPPAPPVTWSPGLSLVDFLPLVDESANSFSSSPLEPPPRSVRFG